MLLRKWKLLESVSATVKPSKQLKASHNHPASETSFKWRVAGRQKMAQYCMLAGLPLCYH